jgi:hypothetical protein
MANTDTSQNGGGNSQKPDGGNAQGEAGNPRGENGAPISTREEEEPKPPGTGVEDGQSISGDALHDGSQH